MGSISRQYGSWLKPEEMVVRRKLLEVKETLRSSIRNQIEEQFRDLERIRDQIEVDNNSGI